jgi:predicted permease
MWGKFVERLLPRLSELHGVQSAATANGLPLDWARENLDIAFTIEGRPVPKAGETLIAGLRQASPDYFKTLEISLALGRCFTAQDSPAAPSVVMVNESFRRRYFPRDDIIGWRISSPDFGPTPCEIVGVVKDVKRAGLDVPVTPEVYRPQLQSCFSLVTIVVRSRLKPVEVVASVRKAVAALDPDVPVYNPRTMARQVAVASGSRRFSMLLMGLLAGLALSLGIVGIFAVLSSIVAARTKEIGIRMALGAQARTILLSVIGHGMTLVGVGAALGLIGAILLARYLRSLLFEVTPLDPVTFVVVPLALGLVALLACWLPARRAAKVDPMVILRAE